MSNLNVRIGFLGFSDSTVTNNPSIRNVDLTYQLLGQVVSRPSSEEFVIPPGFTQSVFNGTRTTGIDNTTAFTVSQPYPATPNQYRFTNSTGTAPAFRTARAIGVDDTSQVVITVSGSVATLTFSGGTLPNLASVQVGDILRIDPGSNFNSVNQGTFAVLSKTSNSVTIKNISATPETVVMVAAFFQIYSNGGLTNQIQIGDKVTITAGFSPVTQGTYQITDLSPTFFEVYISTPNGIPLEVNVTPSTSGIAFYSQAKRYIMIAAQNRCSVQVNADLSDNTLIEPTQPENPEAPGIYFKQGTVYSLTVRNLGITPLSITVATAE